MNEFNESTYQYTTYETYSRDRDAEECIAKHFDYD